MIYLDALTEKTENVSDTDIMLIEDDEDTKKIQIKTKICYIFLNYFFEKNMVIFKKYANILM